MKPLLAASACEQSGQEAALGGRVDNNDRGFRGSRFHCHEWCSAIGDLRDQAFDEVARRVNCRREFSFEIRLADEPFATSHGNVDRKNDPVGLVDIQVDEGGGSGWPLIFDEYLVTELFPRKVKGFVRQIRRHNPAETGGHTKDFHRDTAHIMICDTAAWPLMSDASGEGP